MSAALSSDMSYEEAMARLEEVVSALEEGRLPLDKLVDGYEEGMQLLKQCRRQIDVARVRIEKVTADADGRAALVPFDPQAAESGTGTGLEPAAESGAGQETETEAQAPAAAAPAPAAPAPRRRRAAEPPPAEADDGEIRLF